MKIFNDFIDISKDLYITCVENKNTLFKSAASLFLTKFIIVLMWIIIGIISISILSIDVIMNASKSTPPDLDPVALIGFVLMMLVFVLLSFILAPIKLSITYYGSISLYEKKSFELKEMFTLIKENYLKLLWGNLLISIILTVIIPILYIVGLIVIIPLTILTYATGAIVLISFVSNTYTYWALLSIKDKTSPFAALEKNINLGFHKLAIITIFTLLLITASATAVGILGVFAFLVSIILALLADIVMGLAVLKIDDLK